MRDNNLVKLKKVVAGEWTIASTVNAFLQQVSAWSSQIFKRNK